jgi:hypothetical protein
VHHTVILQDTFLDLYDFLLRTSSKGSSFLNNDFTLSEYPGFHYYLYLPYRQSIALGYFIFETALSLS